MWIEETANGKYKFSERYKDPYTDKLKKVSIVMENKTRQTQKDALYILNNKIQNKTNNKELISKRMTFKELFDEWYPIYMMQVAEGTYLPTKNIFTKLIEDIGSNTLISKVDSNLIVDTLESYIYSQKLSNKYVSIIKSKLNLIFSYALNKKYIDSNPIEKIKINYKREFATQKTKDKYLEDTEYTSLIEFTESINHKYALLFQWMYLTGLRPGEALALYKDDIHLTPERNYVIVEGTLLYRERSIKEVKKSNRTKTAAGMREVDLPQKAVDIYNELVLLNPNGIFLFQTSKGTPFQLTAINSFLRVHKEEMGFEKDKTLSSHIFRHTHISKLAEIGTPMYVIQERVGHEDSKITQQIYLHVTQKTREKLQSNLDLL